MTTLHEHREAFDDRNLFLQVTLGLLSVCQQFETIVLAYGPAKSRANRDTVARPDSFLDCVLGVAALMDRVVSEAQNEAAASVAAVSCRPAAAPHAAPEPKRLLV